MTAASAASVAVTHRASLEPLFADDCADFPLLPGVSVLEYARMTAEAHLPAEGLRLRAVDRVRFTGVALPGEELTVELEWTPVGEDEWACVAVVSTGRGKASSARLRYVGEAGR
ncbi:hypothetical protein ASD97_03365 [Streptomyces sp. Root63]|uniref:hypothetical protein n=1 Tax=Streptomyces TaxID=1883 RepID=UPI0006F65C36|nr:MULTISPECIES: hypothetical protein [Streptomyces]KQX28483.1 hypothetical protein ASD29_25320 [Streptomyces sp. Root1295]KRA49521.1 hypothetical protein ASD97_03365 [Streptomyces sp. Root63]MBT1101916.1 hypothetical protein [Streptomyces sp. Tu10]WUC89505.1 hypothetical protein OHQ35_26975 [Streptomyces anulatus]